MSYTSLKVALAAGSAFWAAHAAPASAQAAASQAGAVSTSMPNAAVEASSVATPQPALSGRSAPQPAANSPSTVGEVVVTAQRRQERLQDVPISITVFSQQQLSDRNITQATDLATYTPSLSSDSFFGSNNTSFSIRGFNQQFGTSPTVGVYFADVIAPRAATNNIPVGDGAGPGNFFDLQNIQVLKGPQGTLFGLNTTGGAVLLVPQKPTDKFEGYVEGSYGDYDMKRIQAVVNIPFGDKVRFRVGVDHESRQGYLTNTTGIGPTHFDDINFTAVRASLDADLTPNVENYTIFSFLDSQTNGDLSKVFAVDQTSFFGAIEQSSLNAAKNVGFYSTQNTFDDPFTRETQWQLINTTTWHPSDDLVVKDIISYAQLKENISSTLFGTDLDLHYFAALAGVYPLGTAKIGIADVFPVPGGNTADQSTFTNELQLQGNALDHRLVYQGGVYYERSDPIGVAGVQADNLVFCTNPASTTCANLLSGSVSISNAKVNYTDVGLYLQSTYSITRQLRLTGGFRYTWDTASTNGQQYAYRYNFTLFPSPPIGLSCVNPDSVAPNCVVSYKESSSAPTGLVDLDYKPVNDLLLYAKYSRGYRAGGITAQVPTEFAIYQPEHLNAYETGLKATFRGPIRGTLDVASFYNDFADEQIQAAFVPRVTGSLAQQSGTVNANKSRSYGVEIDASITPFTGLTLDIAYAYIEANILSTPTITTPANSPYVASSVAFNGDVEEFTPKNKYTVSATYELPVSRDIGRISIGGDFTFIDNQVTNYGNRDAAGNLSALSILGSRKLLDLNFNWKSVARSPVDISAFATNVANEHYYNEYAGIYSAGFDTASVGAPRMYGIRVRYHFGG